MNGFKFTDLKCLAMMVLIIMAFCGDAGQYLLMAATLIWLIAKVLELHRSRKKAPPAQKGKEPAKPASPPAVQPVPANRPAAGAQQPPKPAAAKPQSIDPETEAVMLRHINFQITEKLQGAFPSAVWRWETEKPLGQAVKGGSARIRLSGVPDWNFADVRFERSGRIRLEMLSLRSLEEIGQQQAKSAPTADGDAVNLRDWYDLSASAVVRAAIDEVYTRGYRELRIAEDGALYVLEQQEQVGQGRLSYLPSKKLWADLVPFFEEDDITAMVEDDILLTWAN